jgi:type I restriction enzyme S subunit
VKQKWPVKTIAECAAPEPYATQIGPFGKALTPEDYTPSGVPLLRGVNVNHGRFYDDDYVFISEETAARFDKYESHPGDVLLVHKGTLGEIGLMPKNRKYPKYIMGNSMLRVKCNPQVLMPEFLYYWLASANGQHYLFSRVSQVGVPQIQTPLKTLREAPLPVPPLPVQRQITAILGTLDDKIESNHRMNLTLEAMARAIFQSWFVDFDPVRVKADGRALAGMDAAPAALFPDHFEDAELGKIPAGWKVCPLPEAIAINPPRNLPKGTVAPYLEMGNMPTGSARALNWFDREFGSGMRFCNGDTLVARITPCLENGKMAYVDFLADGQVGWGSTEYIVLHPLEPLPPEYAYFLARTADFRNHAIINMTGTSGRQRVPVEAFDRYLIVVPPEPIAKRFGALASTTIGTMKQRDEESRTLAALRDTLLPKLISGELRAPEAERIAGRTN